MVADHACTALSVTEASIHNTLINAFAAVYMWVSVNMGWKRSTLAIYKKIFSFVTYVAVTHILVNLVNVLTYAISLSEFAYTHVLVASIRCAHWVVCRIWTNERIGRENLLKNRQSWSLSAYATSCTHTHIQTAAKASN